MRNNHFPLPVARALRQLSIAAALVCAAGVAQAQAQAAPAAPTAPMAPNGALPSDTQSPAMGTPSVREFVASQERRDAQTRASAQGGELSMPATSSGVAREPGYGAERAQSDRDAQSILNGSMTPGQRPARQDRG